MTDRLAHHSFSLKRQQIIKPCRAQLDRAAWNTIGTVFNTFWRRLATGFLDLCRVVLPFQAICPAGIAGRSRFSMQCVHGGKMMLEAAAAAPRTSC
ncbi:MAG: hypothetical protein E5W78_08415 [Mesorhizobium sp.]|nr:MAG: hypothetical protein E5W78_08415 [Mesorhizobium sp.]